MWGEWEKCKLWGTSPGLLVSHLADWGTLKLREEKVTRRVSGTWLLGGWPSALLADPHLGLSQPFLAGRACGSLLAFTGVWER